MVCCNSYNRVMSISMQNRAFGLMPAYQAQEASINAAAIKYDYRMEQKRDGTGSNGRLMPADGWC